MWGRVVELHQIWLVLFVHAPQLNKKRLSVVFSKLDYQLEISCQTGRTSSYLTGSSAHPLVIHIMTCKYLYALCSAVY